MSDAGQKGKRRKRSLWEKGVIVVFNPQLGIKEVEQSFSRGEKGTNKKLSLLYPKDYEWIIVKRRGEGERKCGWTAAGKRRLILKRGKDGGGENLITSPTKVRFHEG